jgi:hypothetical protein
MQFSVTDATGGTIAIPAYTQRRQSLLRITGARVWVNFNEPAVVGQCEYIDAGDSLRFWGDRATANVYLVCATGEAATAYVVEGATNMEIIPGVSKNAAGGSEVTIIDPETGDAAKVNDDGQLHIVAEGHLCTLNSTTTPLAGDASYVGTATNILAYNAISVFVTSDQDSATGGLAVQFSRNGVNDWRTAESYNILAGAEKFFSPPSFGVYMRVSYTNGSLAQTTFELTTVLRKVPFKWSSHNIETPITDQDDAELVKSVITGKKANGDYDNVSLTNGGNAKISIEEFESGVSEDGNTSLRTAPILQDEFGNSNRTIGDNIFRGAPIVIATEHHEIHCGDSYETTYNVTLGNNAGLDFLITTPNWGTVDGTNTGADQDVKVAHVVGIVESESELEVQFWEGPTVTTAGTALTVVNRNFNSTFTDFLTITQGGSVSDDGVNKWGPWRVGSGRSVAGSAERTREFVLKNDTTYLLRITNQTTASNNVNVELDYYVHPGV